MGDLERTRQTVAVLNMLDESHRAYAEGRTGDFDRIARQACELDVNAVAIITGGMRIGEIPSPERDPDAWADFLAANRDQLATLEAVAASGGDPA